MKSDLSIQAGQVLRFLLAVVCLAGCGSRPGAPVPGGATAVPQASSISPASTAQPTSQPFDITRYAFPETVDPTSYYLFYLHGKIIEDQGLPAVSPDYGTYEYPAILEKLSRLGLIVISEQRAENTDALQYAQRLAGQVTRLLNSGVPAKNITVAGASKGGAIAILASNLLENEALNFVLLAACDPASIDALQRNKVSLYGNVLSIYDSADKIAGSCQELFAASAGKGLSRHAEIVLQVGSGHGMLFKPLDEWITPTLRWTGSPLEPDCGCEAIPTAPAH